MTTLEERRKRLGWSIENAVSQTGTSKAHILMCEKSNTELDKMLLSERLYDKALLKAEAELCNTILHEITERAGRKEQK